MFGVNVDINNLPFDKIEKEFIDIVKIAAAEREVEPENIALFVGPKPIKSRLRNKETLKIRCEIMSLADPEEFDSEIVKISTLTAFDMGNHISQAFKQILQVEHEVHNDAIKTNSNTDTVKQIPEELAYEHMSMCIAVEKQEGSYDLNMTVLNDNRFMRVYNLRKEFSL